MNTIRIDGYRIKTRISKGRIIFDFFSHWLDEESHHSSKSSYALLSISYPSRKEAPSGTLPSSLLSFSVGQNTLMAIFKTIEENTQCIWLAHLLIAISTSIRHGRSTRESLRFRSVSPLFSFYCLAMLVAFLMIVQKKNSFTISTKSSISYPVGLYCYC